MTRPVGSTLRDLALCVACCAAFCASPLRAEEPYSFAVFGDQPYDDEERAELPDLLQQMKEEKASFAVHIGDLKDPNDPCSDEAYADRFEVFQQSPLPLVYVPGEGDWLSCARQLAGTRDPAERLGFVRKLFYGSATSLGTDGFELRRQSTTDETFAPFREHQSWVRGPVKFLTLNLPGGDNNWGKAAQAGDEHLLRMAAVREWMETAFDEAKKQGLLGVVVLAHANPDFPAFVADHPARGYAEFLQTLRALVEDFPGQVLYIHGDTHVMRTDRPLLQADGQPLQRFRDVEVYGSPIIGWVEVTVDTARPNLFRVRSKPLKPDTDASQPD
ncbi:hypothetical protein [Niveibacterium sp. SC-1]|uniref:hypothetical protein n=1 Tax=Niveibacterium sp. SC-1 TaxID=3135646 RepID=UPI00311FEE8D